MARATGWATAMTSPSRLHDRIWQRDVPTWDRSQESHGASSGALLNAPMLSSVERHIPVFARHALPFAEHRVVNDCARALLGTRGQVPAMVLQCLAPAIWPVAATTPRCHIPAMRCCSGELAHGRIHQPSCRVF
jgi:hypothetical protein